MVGACDNQASSGDGPDTSGTSVASSGSTPPACLPAADVSSAAGLAVREFPQGSRTHGDTVVCAYQATDNELGVSVTTVVGPAAQSEDVFNEMRESVQLFLGANAEPEVIQVGERGYAYGSMSKSEAAAVSGGRLYHAEVLSSASADIGDRKDGMIEIVQKLAGQ